MDASPRLNSPGFELLTTGPGNFAGAATIHSRIITALAALGATTTFVGFTPSFHAASLEYSGVRCYTPEIISDAYPNSDSLRMLAVVEELYRGAIEALAKGRSVIFLASYLFPFHQAAVLAAERLRAIGRVCQVIAIPAGSDIWQIGHQVPGAVRWLLSPERTDLAVVYSRRFASEVRKLAGGGVRIQVIPPPVDTSIFRPVTHAAKRDLREAMGIPPDSFVLLHCSNLRPVKRLDSVIELAIAIATKSKRRILLLIVGPWTSNAAEDLVRLGIRQDLNSLGRSRLGSLEILVVGLQSNTERFHQIGDIALNASIHDSFNASLAESMACGLPAVSSDVVGIAGLIRRYRCGQLFSYPAWALESLRQGRNVSILRDSMRTAADYICELADRPDLKEEVGRRSIDAISLHCNIRRVARRWTDLIGGLLRDSA